MLIYNTYTREKEEFKPIEENKVKMYICGPTVYNYIHIGNARPVLFFDLVHRYFKYLGYEVEFVSNVTDVDDKIINRAIEEEVTEAEIAEKYLNYFLECNQLLNALPFTSMPKVTENMDEMIRYLENTPNLTKEKVVKALTSVLRGREGNFNCRWEIIF